MSDTVTARMIRFEVTVDDQWHQIIAPAHAAIKHVGCRQPDVVEFWIEALVPGEHGLAVDRPREFRVYGTGQPYNLHECMFQGTAIAPSGQLVWHLMEKNPQVGR